MKYIETPNAPAPGGHYSQAVAVNGFIFLAGQLPIAGDGEDVPSDAGGQLRLVFANIEAILKAAGAGISDIVNATIFVKDISLWPEINAAYAEILGDHRPARTVAVSPQLHFDALVEVQIVAAAPG
ncbi:2-iminobutanoate/2-iminopropanoate deaminase [Roseovarius pacificus]|uniref:2-iminobutanoate/2-iminopropanoate deaminase n=1 Tax=Roseovarius pacificus TaxID=337701 RepID=A0A1M7A349_9RHOB|nr:RidA family protein [Roseovarius pacificus]GGO53952.1 reactive intermediate/imine deaminase [Roseovarius pacificus]SHL37039.1 2-iminobutanoate/2-iminopropanoate deaminase [Roseovarius pacificus]